jgi:hypothetical protein
MLKVYLDKNVLSHIISSQCGATETNGVTVDDLKALLKAVAEGKITVLLGFMHLQEAAYALRASSPEVAKNELQLIKDLMDTKQVINFPRDLLINDVISYAKGESPKSPFIPNTLDLEQEFSTTEDTEERMRVLKETDKHNADFLRVTTDAKANDKTYVLGEFDGKRPSFEDFYQKKIEERIVATVQRVEDETKSEGLLEACKERGIGGMIDIKSIALAEGAGLSYQYARVFDKLSEKQTKRLGDASDLQHALLASAADILVTHDEDFAFWIERIPHKGVEVLDHVHRLVERL